MDYTTQQYGFQQQHWHISAGARHASVPGSGSTLYLKDWNCGCVDPTRETVLNPAAWVDQVAGVSGRERSTTTTFAGSGGRSKPRKGFPNVTEALQSAHRSNGVLTGGFRYMNHTTITSNAVGGTPAAHWSDCSSLEV